jgi:hypothetical protein
MVSNYDADGIGYSYESYLKLKDVLDVVEKISHTSSDSKEFLYDNQMIAKKITQSEAVTILSNIYSGKWDKVTALIKVVANQVGINLNN